MSEVFFRLVLENKQTNYAFLCGGTINEILDVLTIEDEVRADHISTVEDLKALFAHSLKLNDKDKGQFLVKPYENGLILKLLYDGAADSVVPKSSKDDPQANLLLKALFSAFKPPEDPNESH